LAHNIADQKSAEAVAAGPKKQEITVVSRVKSDKPATKKVAAKRISSKK
jgi:hypothetical protein